MQDGKRISYYGVDDNSVIEFMPTLRASGPDVPSILSNKLLDHRLDFDFSNMSDDGKEYYRGGHRYYRPYGWRRIALKVAGKYENDTWLGTGGIRTDSSPGEWPVSYHGTKKENAKGIAAEGYKLSKGKRFRFTRGIYSSPNIEVAEKGYAVNFNHGRTTYKVVFQNRVCPNGLEIIPAEKTRSGEYWIQPEDKLIRPYGLCIKQVS